MNWKSPPNDGSKLWIGKSLELQVLLACNWSCVACDQFSNNHAIAWIRRATMTLKQIEFFVQELRNANAYLGRIRLLGGEPSLHPQLPEIVDLLRRLVADGHLGSIEIITNGSHPEKLQMKDVRIRVSDERSKQKHHVANLVQTPASLGYQGKMCNCPWHCGISLNYYGYFPCSAGAGLARLMNNMEQWQRLRLPLRPVLEEWPDLQELCNHCYHALRTEHKIRCGTGSDMNQPNKQMSGYLNGWADEKQINWKVYAV